MNMKTLKKAFKITFIILIAIVLIHVVSLFTLDKSIEYKEVPFHSAKIPPEMDGYRIAFIIDTHSMSAQELEKVVAKTNEFEPDLLILGGDFASCYETPKSLMEVWTKAVTVDGIYGVEGNHDDYVYLFQDMEYYSIKPLSNSGVRIRDGFYLAGVGDLWNRSPDIAKSIADAGSDDFVLLIAHHPDVTMTQDTTGVDLILSGHTHGGHVTFFGIWAPGLTLGKTVTDYGQRFMSGWAESGDGTPVYVSRGTGNLSNSQVPRVFARPQVILMTLAAKQIIAD